MFNDNNDLLFKWDLGLLFEANTFIDYFVEFGVHSVIYFFLLVYWLGMIQYELFLSMIYLVFAVCEGSLGLGILISIVRSHGNDYFQSLVVLRC